MVVVVVYVTVNDLYGGSGGGGGVRQKLREHPELTSVRVSVAFDRPCDPTAVRFSETANFCA